MDAMVAGGVSPLETSRTRGNTDCVGVIEQMHGLNIISCRIIPVFIQNWGETIAPLKLSLAMVLEKHVHPIWRLGWPQDRLHMHTASCKTMQNQEHSMKHLSLLFGETMSGKFALRKRSVIRHNQMQRDKKRLDQ